MLSLRLFTVVLEALAGIVAVAATAIVLVRVLRKIRHRRRAILAAGPRRVLIAFAAENGEHGGHDLVAIPADAWRAAEPTALALLGKLRGEAHAALVSVFLRRGIARTAVGDLHSRSRVRRARAAQVLGDLEHREAVPELCRLLTDRHDEVRVVALRALGRIGDPAAAWRIIAALDGADPVPSLLATHSLVQLGAEAELTLSAALDHPQARVRAVCLDALGLLGATGSVHRMAAVLDRDTHLDVRVAAAVNLGRLGTRTAAEPLALALNPAWPAPLRAAAARALGDLGAPAAVPALAALLVDDQFQVAHEAAHALRRLDPSGTEALVVAVEAEHTRTGAEPGTPGRVVLAASHAQEALALARVSTERTEVRS